MSRLPVLVIRPRVDRPAQQELRQPVARPQLVGLGVVPGAHEVTQRLARLVGDPDRCEVAAAQQPGELRRVTAVGLHPVARLGGDERRRDDDALDAEGCELAVQRVAGRTGLVGDAQPGPGTAEALEQLADRRRVIRDLPVVLRVAERPSDRDGDRRLVHVEPDEPRTLLHWTGLPHVALRGLSQAARAIHDDARAPVLPC
jgi:hypothetical protein